MPAITSAAVCDYASEEKSNLQTTTVCIDFHFHLAAAAKSLYIVLCSNYLCLTHLEVVLRRLLQESTHIHIHILHHSYSPSSSQRDHFVLGELIISVTNIVRNVHVSSFSLSDWTSGTQRLLITEFPDSWFPVDDSGGTPASLNVMTFNALAGWRGQQKLIPYLQPCTLILPTAQVRANLFTILKWLLPHLLWLCPEIIFYILCIYSHMCQEVRGRNYFSKNNEKEKSCGGGAWTSKIRDGAEERWRGWEKMT